MDEHYSIRESLQGKLQSFIRDSAISSIPLEDLIRDAVVLLSAYREEDKPYFPELYVAEDQQDLATLLKIGRPVTIGRTPATTGAASVILKECATLATGGWAIFSVLKNGSFEYGVFRSVRHSLSTSADETIADLGRETKIMLIRNRGHQRVELQNTSQGRLTASFKITSSSGSALEAHVKTFVMSTCEKLQDSSGFAGYLARLLTETLQHSHGTLLAVTASCGVLEEEITREGISFDPPLDLYVLHTAAISSLDADSLADLSAAENLVRGMIHSDGVVVFSPDGVLRGYRLFVRATATEMASIPAEGGTRRRAYNTLRSRIPTLYCAALYRSQDGETLCERSSVNNG